MNIKTLNRDYRKIISGHPGDFYQDYLLALKEVEDSSAYYKGKPVDFLYQALFFSNEHLLQLQYLSSTLVKILKKVIAEYRNNPIFRRNFPFSSLMEELILIDPGYSNEFPIARFDIFYPYNQHAKFCELNADGSSAMNEVRVIEAVIRATRPFKILAKTHHFAGFELFYSWITALLTNYQQYKQGEQDRPNIAIVDFKDEGTINEFKEFQQRLIASGYQTVICDPRELKYNRGKLYYQDSHIQLIYRRATTVRLLEEATDIADFIQAYRDGVVCVVGGLRSQIIHNKVIFAILHDQGATPFLEREEREFIQRHIPFTQVLKDNSSEMLNHLLEQKDSLVLKPFDQAASKGVYVGRDYTSEQWRSLILASQGKDYLLQEFVEIPQMEMATVDQKKARIYFENYGYLIGMFLYNQQLQGLYTRAGRQNIIGAVAESYTVPNFVVREE